MNLEVKKNSVTKNYDVKIDGKIVGYEYDFSVKSADSGKHFIHINEDSIDIIEAYYLNEFREKVACISFPFDFPDDKIFQYFTNYNFDLYPSGYHKKKDPYIKLEIQVDTENWKNPYSLTDLVKEMKISLQDYGNCEYHSSDGDSKDGFINNGFGMIFTIKDVDILVKDVNNLSYNIFNEILTKSIFNLNEKGKRDSLITVFNFREDIRVPCEQYLLYFSKFLEDIGIDAKTSVTEQAQNVLFTVTPKDGSQALSKIKEVLDIYLLMAEQPNIETLTHNYSDIGVHQLLFNIFHLKSQLKLASEMLRLKDDRIETLSLSNFQYKQLLDKKPEINGEEELFPGLISVKKIDKSGIVINLPEILRRIKRKLK